MFSKRMPAASQLRRRQLQPSPVLLQVTSLLVLLLGAAVEPRTALAESRLMSSPLLEMNFHRHRAWRANEKQYCGVIQVCCSGRNDGCAVPLNDTLCYCDDFCDRERHDCCPDFWRTCRKTIIQWGISNCWRDNEVLNEGARMRRQCNVCTCTRTKENDQRSVLDWECSDEPCVVEDWLVHKINAANLGWTAHGYRAFASMSLEQGVRHLLGTASPTAGLADVRPVSAARDRWMLSEEFDARSAWPERFIRPPRDQGRCGSDWAIATADVLADRLSIISNGAINNDLSAQQLVSCTGQEHGCGDIGGGRVEEAFSYMSGQGVVTEDCYPYRSGRISARLNCSLTSQTKNGFVVCPNGNLTSKLYKGTPPYRIANNEWQIMTEIRNNGPVLAIMEVWPDFYLYREGVYRRSRIADKEKEHIHNSRGYHAVRIIGWGVKDSTKYWLVANSWGRGWGNEGTFKILRGVNECSIESFVVGVWGVAESP